jgi:membrane associated rhomboid family serine protease
MTPSEDTSFKSIWRTSWPLVILMVLCIAIELALSGADRGLWGAGSLRQRTYEYAGFWPGLLQNWQPNYAGQSYLMFLTYSLLHGGLAHLLVNMFSLWSMGRAVLARVGVWGFCLLYLGSVLGGALGFGLLSESLIPMVGASGALFGLAGGVLAWNYVDRFALQDTLWPIAQAAIILIILNIVLWYAMDGLLAWETHLGGFVAGWIMALLIDPQGKTVPDEN